MPPFHNAAKQPIAEDRHRRRLAENPDRSSGGAVVVSVAVGVHT